MVHAKKLVDELLKLPRGERSEAAETLLASLEDEAGDADVDDAWATEIQHRIHEDAPGIPAEQVFAEGRSRLKRDS